MLLIHWNCRRTIFSVYDPINGGTNIIPGSNSVALYHFTNSLVTDSSGNGNTLTIYTASDSAGPFLGTNTLWMRSPTTNGHVASFTNAGDYLKVTFPATNFPNTNYGGGSIPLALTIDAWIYPRAYLANSNILVLGSGYYGSSCSPSTNTTNWGSSQWGLSCGLGTPQVVANNAYVISSNQWSQLCPLNTWSHLQITFDATLASANTKVYIGGNLQCCSSCMPQPNEPMLFTLGNFDGDIAEVEISNAVLITPGVCPCNQNQ
jgi:Concanavalin A-like lectin/glucanases superfamily